MVKRCAWGTCKTDSRYPERLIKDGIAVNFHPFPSEKKFKDRRESWIRACCRADDFVCNKSTYICSLHFVEKEGPTERHPDPIPATASRDKVCNMYSFVGSHFKDYLQNIRNACTDFLLCMMLYTYYSYSSYQMA